MLLPASKRRIQAVEGTYVIVAAEYNRPYVDGMLAAARRIFRSAGARRLQVIRVPGAFEIPVVAAELASSDVHPPAAILCLGLIVRGATAHADHIGEAVTSALQSLQCQTRVPIIHEVLLVGDLEQARERCRSRSHNRGAEGAQTALAMAACLRNIRRAASV